MIPHYGHEQQLVVFIEEHGVTRTTRFPHSHNLDDYGFIPSTPAHMGTHPEGKVNQGAGWSTGWWRYTHGVPYPADDADTSAMQSVLQEIPGKNAGAADRLELERYFLDDWNARHIRLLLDAAAAWGNANGVPVVCDEFGAFRDHSDPAARQRWIHDVRTALEADGMGWTMWDYRGNFGVVTKAEGQAAVPDPRVVQALGLKQP